MLKKVHLHILTERFGITMSLFDIILNGNTEALLESEINNENPMMEDPEKIELFCEGRLHITEDDFTLSYEENAMSGMEGSTTQISFSFANPGLVTMIRSGSVRTALVFEKGQRHICSYTTMFMPFEICVQTIDITNDLQKRGKLVIDYLVEIRGAQAEHCKLLLDLKE